MIEDDASGDEAPKELYYWVQPDGTRSKEGYPSVNEAIQAGLAFMAAAQQAAEDLAMSETKKLINRLVLHPRE